MYHSITFVNKNYVGPGGTTRNTWDDWHLVPASRPVFSPPALKEHIIDIPGKDGVLDFTDSLTGYPMFERREGSFEFIVMNGYQEWHALYSTISAFLHGHKLKAILEDEPDKYYEGRFVISDWKSEKDYSRITIAYKVDPYKWTVQTSSELQPNMFIRTISQPSGFAQIVLILGRDWLITTAPTITATGPDVQIHYVYPDDRGIDTTYYEILEEGTHQINMLNGPIRRELIDSTLNAFYYQGVEGGTTDSTVQVDFRRGYI